MLKIGDYNDLKIVRVAGEKFFLESEEGELPLIGDYQIAEFEIGEEIEVFVFTENNGDLIATMSTPYATVDEFACLTVVDTNKHGAFLDWGIEKDLFVHVKEQRYPMKVGRKYVVYLRRDKNNGRVQGTSYLDPYFEEDVSELEVKQRVSLMIYAITEIGIMAIIDNTYSGMLYINECFEKVSIGDMKQGYIKQIREDGKIDLTFQPHIVKAISDSKSIVLEKLKEADGFLPLHDKSDPEEIKKTLSMSKKNFKRAIGGLYKEKKIYISETGISLVKS